MLLADGAAAPPSQVAQNVHASVIGRPSLARFLLLVRSSVPLPPPARVGASRTIGEHRPVSRSSSGRSRTHAPAHLAMGRSGDRTGAAGRRGRHAPKRLELLNSRVPQLPFTWPDTRAGGDARHSRYSATEFLHHYQ
jgi:hypothetical protein